MLLTSLRILEANVELAVLAVRSRGKTLAGLRDKAVVEQSEGAQVAGENAGDSSGVAAGAGIADTGDLHTAGGSLLRDTSGDVGEALRVGLGNRRGQSQGKGSEEKLELHCNSKNRLDEEIKSRW